MNTIHLKIVTLEETIYDDVVEKIVLPTKSGIITILPNHMTLVSVIAPGEMAIYTSEEKISMAVTKGFIEVQPESEVVIMADTVDRIDEMDVDAIKKAKERVERILKEENSLSDVEFAHFEDVLSREISRLDIAHKYRNKKYK